MEHSNRDAQTPQLARCTADTAFTGQGMLIRISVHHGISVLSVTSGCPYSVTSRASPWSSLARGGKQHEKLHRDIRAPQKS